jgi:adenylate cyclase
MGVHAADVVVEADDIFGDGVNVAARLQELAPPGGVCLSGRVQEDTQGRIDVDFDDLGDHQLKNIPRPVRVWGVRLAGAQAEPSVVRPAGPQRTSIAVLPFQNRSRDPEQDYFAEAITDDLVTALSRWRWFFVVAHSSTVALHDQALEPARIGRELGVSFLLEGNVRRMGERVRINVRLIDAANGGNAWADRFDRDLSDLLALQDEIVDEVVAAIEPAMLRTEAAQAGRKHLRDYTALDCFYRGMWHLNRISEEGYHEALALFREAITRDPELPFGYIGLARILYGAATIYGWSKEPQADLEAARKAALTAIRLDARDASAHYALAGAALYLGRHDEALDAARKAVALNPNFALGYTRLGNVLMYLGRADEAVEAIERSLRHSPFDPQRSAILGSLALAHYQARNYAEAAAQARAALQLGNPHAVSMLAGSLAQQGELDAARALLPPEIRPAIAANALRMATFADASDRAHYLEGLTLAGVALEPQAAESYIEGSPRLGGASAA